MTRLLGALCLAFLITAPAFAHERSRSNSRWLVNEQSISAELYLDARQATLLLQLMPDGTSLESAYAIRISEALQVRRGAQACQLDAAAQVTLLSDGRLRGAGRWSCAQDRGPVEITVEVYPPLSANQVQFLWLEFGDGLLREAVLSRGNTTARFAPDEAPPGLATRVGRFLAIGVEHILLGPDHLAFLAALLLVVSGWRRIAGVTLGFTLGHSITLALAVLGWVTPPTAAIEALIGFSIVFVAAEAALERRLLDTRGALVAGGGLAALGALNLLTGGSIAWPVWAGLAIFTACYAGWLGQGGKPQAAAPALSAGFGLIHGVGFAGILLEFELPASDRIPALIGFNLGVEMGQLIFVGAVSLVSVYGLSRLPNARQLGRTALVAGLAGIGLFWFLTRAWG